MPDPAKLLYEISNAPSDSHAFERWLQMHDAIAFLKTNASQDEFVAYASLRGTYIHALLVPGHLLSAPDIEDLMRWQGNAHQTWFIGEDSSNSSVTIQAPPSFTSSSTLDQGKQLVFDRSFAGRVGEQRQCEILQEFVHVFDLLFLPERNSYSRFDKHGDLEDGIRIVQPSTSQNSDGGIVSFRAVLFKGGREGQMDLACKRLPFRASAHEMGAEVSKPGLVVRVHVIARRMPQSYCWRKMASKRNEPHMRKSPAWLCRALASKEVL